MILMQLDRKYQTCHLPENSAFPGKGTQPEEHFVDHDE